VDAVTGAATDGVGGVALAAPPGEGERAHAHASDASADAVHTHAARFIELTPPADREAT
jgi:hypothetical protein